MGSRIILLSALLLAIGGAAAAGSRSWKIATVVDQADKCAGRRIHIRRLPARFNEELLRNCSAYSPAYDDFCPYLANNGLGQKTFNHSRSWYRSDPAVLEPLFHSRLLEYPCLTDDPSAADAVFLPYYTAIDALRYLYGPLCNSSFEHGVELFDFLLRDDPGIWARRGGHDHFLVMAGPAWDFSQSPVADPPIWGTSFLELPEFYNLTALVFESRSWPWQEQAIPYPTSFHPASLPRLEIWLGRARRSRRPTLMMFSGAGGGGTNSPPNIRRSIRAECENRTALCEFVDCSNGVCEHDPIRFMRPMLRSVFCLHPPGNTPTRRATFDAMIAGCIPVFFQKDSARSQYGWHLPAAEYERFSVHIPKEDVVARGLSIADVLLAIPRAEVKRMRERVLELAPRVIYRRHQSSEELRSRKDAIDLAVEGTLRKIKRRLRSLQEGEVELSAAL